MTIIGIAFSMVVGFFVLIGWHSIDLLCQCAPLTEDKTMGVMGLFSVIGFMVGIFLSFRWG